MANKETFHLPSVTLEVEFEGPDSRNYDVKEFRAKMKNGLMKRLVSDGVAFRERQQTEHWKKGEGTVSRVETVVDAWAAETGFTCSKDKDLQSRKARWRLEGMEPVIVLMQVND